MIALVGTPVAAADSGPQPKVEYVQDVHWTQEADGTETVAYDAATFGSSNLEGGRQERDRLGTQMFSRSAALARTAGGAQRIRVWAGRFADRHGGELEGI